MEDDNTEAFTDDEAPLYVEVNTADLVAVATVRKLKNGGICDAYIKEAVPARNLNDLLGAIAERAPSVLNLEFPIQQIALGGALLCMLGSKGVAECLEELSLPTLTASDAVAFVAKLTSCTKLRRLCVLAPLSPELLQVLEGLPLPSLESLSLQVAAEDAGLMKQLLQLAPSELVVSGLVLPWHALAQALDDIASAATASTVATAATASSTEMYMGPADAGAVERKEQSNGGSVHVSFLRVNGHQGPVNASDVAAVLMAGSRMLAGLSLSGYCIENMASALIVDTLPAALMKGHLVRFSVDENIKATAEHWFAAADAIRENTHADTHHTAVLRRLDASLSSDAKGCTEALARVLPHLVLVRGLEDALESADTAPGARAALKANAERLCALEHPWPPLDTLELEAVANLLSTSVYSRSLR